MGYFEQEPTQKYTYDDTPVVSVNRSSTPKNKGLPRTSPNQQNRYDDTNTAYLVTYYGFRYYDPVTGRWPSRGPIQEQGGLNLYAFATNDGINHTDYNGLSVFSILSSLQQNLLSIPSIRMGFVGAVSKLTAVANDPRLTIIMPSSDSRLSGTNAPTAFYSAGKDELHLRASPLPSTVAHELFHALDDLNSLGLSRRREEGVAAVLTHHWSGSGPLSQLALMEDELNGILTGISTGGEVVDELIGLQRRWNGLWSSAKISDIHIVTNYGWFELDDRADATDIANTKRHLGYQLSCSVAADAFNELANDFGSLIGNCIKFSCSYSGEDPFLVDLDSGASVDSEYE